MDAAVDAFFASWKQPTRLDDVYGGFQYLYHAEMRAAAGRGTNIGPLSSEEDLRVRRLIQHIAFASLKKRAPRESQAEFAKHNVNDVAVVYAIEELQDLIEKEGEIAKIKGQTVGLALMGGIAQERPSDLIVLREYFKALNPNVADPIKEILDEKNEEYTFDKATELLKAGGRKIEVSLPDSVLQRWYKMTGLQRAGSLTISAATVGLLLYAEYKHDAGGFADRVKRMTVTMGTYWMNHPMTDFNHKWDRSVLEEYILGFRLYLRDFRDFAEKVFPWISKLPFVPASQPNQLIREHGYLPSVCRDLFK